MPIPVLMQNTKSRNQIQPQKISRSSLITGWNDTVVLGPQIPYFSSNIPERHSLYHGRQDVLEMLDKALLPLLIATMGDNEIEDKQAQGLWAFALCVFGGIGKKETAIEYAYR
jgi:hypothetical protein